MNKALRVKKLWSTNPTRFKSITLAEASDKYAEYLDCWRSSSFIDQSKEKPKSFIDWLQSEI